MIGYLYLLIMVGLTSIAQFYIKKGSFHLLLGQGKFGFIRSLLTRNNLNGFVLTMLAPIFYILALRHLPLSTAYVFSSLNVAIVTLIGNIVFKEPLSKVRTGGVILIIAGILCFAF